MEAFLLSTEIGKFSKLIDPLNCLLGYTADICSKKTNLHVSCQWAIQHEPPVPGDDVVHPLHLHKDHHDGHHHNNFMSHLRSVENTLWL